jgi:hypothetical protein
LVLRQDLDQCRRRDFRLLLTSQAISYVGSSFTVFGLPLLVFKLTGSAVGLALTTVAGFLPYLLFGLFIGAWVDRIDRRRAMMVTNLLRGLVVAVVPVLAVSGGLTVWWIYLVAFTNTTLGIGCLAIEGTAVPSLVDRADLSAANAKLRGTFAMGQVAGPLLAGALIGGGFPVVGVFGIDAASFVLAAALLMFVRSPFNAHRPTAGRSVLADVAEGLRYVFSHPVLRNLAMNAALFNLLASTVSAQLVLFAHDRLGATDGQTSLLYGCGALGTAAVLFGAGRFAKRLSFRAATLGVTFCWCALVAGFAATTNVWLGLLLWTAAAGLPSVYAVRTLSYRQAVVPDHLLGRAQTSALVLAWSAQPLGSLAGASIIQATGQVSTVYAGIAVLVAAMTLGFWLGPLGRVAFRA